MSPKITVAIALLCCFAIGLHGQRDGYALYKQKLAGRQAQLVDSLGFTREIIEAFVAGDDVRPQRSSKYIRYWGEAGRVVRREEFLPGGDRSNVQYFEYDDFQRIVRKVDSYLETVWEYGPNGHLATQTSRFQGSNLGVLAERLRFRYKRGQLVALTITTEIDSTKIFMTYQAKRLVKEQHIQYPLKTPGKEQETLWTYHYEGDRLTEIYVQDCLRYRFTYHPDGSLQQEQAFGSNGSIHYQEEYSYLDNGLLARKQRTTYLPNGTGLMGIDQYSYR